METKTIIVCDAIHIDILCEYNDYADIKCGGSPTLGYDFYVDPDESAERMIAFLKKCCKRYGRPFIGASHDIRKNFPVDNLWSREKMDEYIKNHAVC